MHLVSKTHCSAQNLGLGAQTADHWVRRYVRNGSVQKLDWLVVEEIAQLDMALWADLACVGLNADVKFLLLGDFRQLPAVLDSWAGQPISAPLEHSQLVLDLAGGHRHELTENMRSDPGIFDFVKWLQVGEPDAPALEEAKARARELFPAKPETTLVISHARRVAVNAAANRALQPPGAKLLVLETGVEIALPESQLQSPQNRAQNMLVWPGLRLIGQGRLCGRYRGGARARQAGQRAAAEAAGAAARHKAQPRRHLRQLPGFDSARPRQAGSGLRPPVSAPPVRGRVAGDQLRRWRDQARCSSQIIIIS